LSYNLFVDFAGDRIIYIFIIIIII